MTEMAGGVNYCTLSEPLSAKALFMRMLVNYEYLGE